MPRAVAGPVIPEALSWAAVSFEGRNLSSPLPPASSPVKVTIGQTWKTQQEKLG